MKAIKQILLCALNSRWLNKTPCRYGYIGNVEAFDAEFLRSEERQRPGVTVATVLSEAEAWKSCPVRDGLTVIDGGVPREGTIWDAHELQNRKP